MEQLLAEMDQQDLRDAEEAAHATAQVEVRKLEQKRQEQIISALEEKRQQEQLKLRQALTDTETCTKSSPGTETAYTAPSLSAPRWKAT